MNNKTVSSWVRQARYRARRHDIDNNLQIDDVLSIIKSFSSPNTKCAYCVSDAETLDHPFPLKDLAPNVAANVLPICKKCKNTKKNNDLIWMYNEKYITEQLYLNLLSDMLTRNGNELLRAHVRKATGIIE